MRNRGIATAALACLLLTGCGGEPERDAGCVDPSRDVAAGILEGADGSGLQIYPNTGGAIQSPSDGKWWVTFQGDLNDNQPEEMMWILGNIDPVEGPVFSVDSLAATWTDWPKLPGAYTDDFHDTAKTCLRPIPD